MYIIKCVADGIQNYSRFGKIIPRVEKELENLSDFFNNAREEKVLLDELIRDKNVSIATKNIEPKKVVENPVENPFKVTNKEPKEAQKIVVKKKKAPAKQKKS